MHNAKNPTYCYWKFHTTNLRPPLLFCYSLSCVLCFKIHNSKIIFVSEIFWTTNPWLRIPTPNYFLEFCISTCIKQKFWILLLIFLTTNPRPSHPLNTPDSIMCFKICIFQKTLIIIIEIFSEETLGHPHPLDTLSLLCLVFEHSQYEKFKLLF